MKGKEKKKKWMKIWSKEWKMKEEKSRQLLENLQKREKRLKKKNL